MVNINKGRLIAPFIVDEDMKIKVLKQFSHYRLGAFVSGEIAEVPDEYAGHLIEISVAEAIDPQQSESEPEEAENANKRTRNRKP